MQQAKTSPPRSPEKPSNPQARKQVYAEMGTTGKVEPEQCWAPIRPAPASLEQAEQTEQAEQAERADETEPSEVERQWQAFRRMYVLRQSRETDFLKAEEARQNEERAANERRRRAQELREREVLAQHERDECEERESANQLLLIRHERNLAQMLAETRSQVARYGASTGFMPPAAGYAPFTSRTRPTAAPRLPPSPNLSSGSEGLAVPGETTLVRSDNRSGGWFARVGEPMPMPPRPTSSLPRPAMPQPQASKAPAKKAAH